jgi:hypothetical protein
VAGFDLNLVQDGRALKAKEFFYPVPEDFSLSEWALRYLKNSQVP